MRERFDGSSILGYGHLSSRLRTNLSLHRISLSAHFVWVFIDRASGLRARCAEKKVAIVHIARRLHSTRRLGPVSTVRRVRSTTPRKAAVPVKRLEDARNMYTSRVACAKIPMGRGVEKREKQNRISVLALMSPSPSHLESKFINRASVNITHDVHQ